MVNENYNIVVKLTTSCPANCACCTNRKKKMGLSKESNSVFNIETFEKLCFSIKKMGACYICLSGGEPTIVQNIDKYIEIAHANDLAVRINTNGWGITEDKMLKWLALGLEQIVLSIYSLDKESISKIRGNEMLYTKSINAANIISKIRSNNSFTFIIQTVIMRENYMELPEILEFAISNKADFFWPSYLEDAINLPDTRMSQRDIILFKNNIIPKMKQVVDKYIKDTKHRKRLKRCLDKYYYDGYDGYIYHNDDFECGWLGRHLTLYPNGTVYPCPGHEYFSSDCEYQVDYSHIEDFVTQYNTNSNRKKKSSHCRYCPQGVHQELKLYI